jgi:hypothetical protein
MRTILLIDCFIFIIFDPPFGSCGRSCGL